MRAQAAVISALFCVLGLFSSASAEPLSRRPQAAPPVAYTVTPELKDGVLQDLKVDIRFEGSAAGRTHVDLPDAWSGATELYKAIHGLSAEGASVRYDAPQALVLTHAPRARIHLSYRVRQDFPGELSAGRAPFRPTTRPTWFTAVGWTVFAEVEGRHGAPFTFAWGPLPDGWRAASDLDHAPKGPRGPDDLFDSVLIGGKAMRVIQVPAGEANIRIAIHGDWRFTPEAMGGLITRIANTAAGFWRDPGEDYFVAVTPLAAPPGATVQYGVGLGDAFSLWATPDVTGDDIRHILAHEHEHTWFPTKLGGVRTGPQEPLDYWFSEGFTDFYTLRILLRSGEYGLEDFVEDYNRILRGYAASPVKTAPNGLIAARFWDDRSVADLPYQRGLMLAQLWDDRIRRATDGRESLDQVIRRMRDLSAAGERRSAPTALKAVYRALGGGDLSADYRTYVEDGALVRLPPGLFGDCATVITEPAPVFDRGFDTIATNAEAGVVKGVDPEGPAFAAGLRNGMRIVAREAGQPDDPGQDLVYRVRDGGDEKLIRYRPEGRERRVAQQIVLAPDMTPAKRAACTRIMAGE